MHIPVLLDELVSNMNISSRGIYIDCTGGGGGHAAEVLKYIKDGKLIILDRDIDAVARLKDRFCKDERVNIIHSNFSDIGNVMKDLGLDGVNGIYADFGVSNFQLSEGNRGFSFRKEGIIDMRMDTTKGITALDIVNNFAIENIITIISKFGEERFVKRISKEIVRRRVLKKFITTVELAECIKNAVPKKFHKKGVHPATQTFQALRIYVNGELEAISELMGKIDKLIVSGGRFGAISFHSLEDRIVKDALNYYAKECECPENLPICVCNKKVVFKLITRKPITPKDKEVKDNSLSRSAKLRIAERL